MMTKAAPMATVFHRMGVGIKLRKRNRYSKVTLVPLLKKKIRMLITLLWWRCFQ